MEMQISEYNESMDLIRERVFSCDAITTSGESIIFAESVVDRYDKISIDNYNISPKTWENLCKELIGLYNVNRMGRNIGIVHISMLMTDKYACEEHRNVCINERPPIRFDVDVRQRMRKIHLLTSYSGERTILG